MKLFTIGPVNMYEEQMKIGGQQVPYFRNEAFSKVTLHCMDMLKKAMNAPEDSEAIMLTCSGTGAMESTIINAFDKNDHLVVIDGGSFGHRFTQICDLHEIPYTPVKLERGQTLTQELLEETTKGQKVTGLVVNIHETSTGQLYDIKMLSRFCKERDAIFVVDAIAAFLADPIDMTEDGVDVIIVSSQKALALAPGLAIIMASPRILKKAEGIKCQSMYLDWQSHILNGKRGQTPFTPAVRLFYELENRLEIITEQGVDTIVEETAKMAEGFREKIKSIGLSYPDFPLSNAETPVIFPEGVNAYELYITLEEKYGFVVNPSGGELAAKQFRVAHVGNHTEKDFDELFEAIKKEMGK